MRWPFGPPHLTLKPSKKKTKTKKETKKTKEKTKKTRKKRSPQKNSKNTQKLAFQLSVSNFSFFWWLFKISLFLTPWPRKRAPKKHYKNRGCRAFFLESRCASRNGHFWTKKTKIHKFQLSLFCLFSSISTTKNPKHCWNPYFYNVLANQKKRIFKKITLNTENWKKNNFCTPFLKKAIFR